MASPFTAQIVALVEQKKPADELTIAGRRAGTPRR
jgi:hypothetical protein